MEESFSTSDEGKHVVTADGAPLGTVETISGGTAYVTPDDHLDGTTRRQLGWTAGTGDSYRLELDQIDAIDDEEVRLKPDF